MEGARADERPLPCVLAVCLTACMRPAAQAAVEVMSKAHTEETSRQSAADERVRTAKVKPRYEFYGESPFVRCR